MKKDLKIITIILGLIALIIASIIFINKSQNEIYKEERKENKFLTLMIEKEAGSGKYEESSSTFSQEGYYFNEKLSKCENGSKIKYNEKDKTVDVYTTKADKCYVYFDFDKLGSICRGENMAECFAQNYKKDETIYYHDENLTGGAEDLSYRYAGASDDVNNFICLDGGVTTEGKCGEDDSDLYRIIGLFKNEFGIYEMKLIKYDYATPTELGTAGAYIGVYSSNTSNYKGNQSNLDNIGGYAWTSSSNEINEWAGSELRKTNLNIFYVNYLKEKKGIDIDKLITTHLWKLNGYYSPSGIPKVMYDNEMDKVESNPGVPTITKEVEDKIGLMYVSDYGYAADQNSTNNWTKDVNYYREIVANNWIYMGLYDWTISRKSFDNNYAFRIDYNGTIGGNNYVCSVAFGVRPCFYLVSNVQLKEGNGTYENPYRLAL